MCVCVCVWCAGIGQVGFASIFVNMTSFYKQEAIAVNQNWAGHPGYLVQSFDPSSKPDGDGFIVYPRGAMERGNDLVVRWMHD